MSAWIELLEVREDGIYGLDGSSWHKVATFDPATGKYVILPDLYSIPYRERLHRAGVVVA